MKKSLIPLIPCFLAACQPKHSPSETEPPPPAPVPENAASGEIPTPSSFVGLPLEEAEAKAKAADLPHRVIRKDGEEFPVTRDYRPERLNFTVENGIVTEVTQG